jgi:hypothetical protein
MRNLKLLVPALTLAAISSVPLAAQQPTTSPSPDVQQSNPTQPAIPQQTAPAQQNPAQQGSSAAVPVPSSANVPEVSNAELRPVSGELMSKLDTKNAKNGDEVVVKTTEKATIANGLVIPKGSKIMGHVTDVQAHDNNNPNSKITLQFDQAELKGGQTMPIKSVLQSVAPQSSSDAGQAASPFGTGSAPSAPAATGSAGSMGSPSGGSASPSGSASMPSAGNTAAPAYSSGGASPTGGPAAGTVVAHQGNVDIKTTSIPGVLIAANSNGQPFANASGALLGAKQNVHLDGGTQVTLAIADANTKASVR